MRFLLPLGAVVLIFGALLLLLRSTDDGTRPDLVGATNAGVDVRDTGRPGELDPAREAERAEARRAPTDEQPSATTDPASPAPTRLLGRVVDELGDPVPGVEVTAHRPENSMSAWWGGEDAEDEALGRAATDARGRFDLACEDDAPARVELRFRARGFAPLDRPSSPTPGRALDLGDVVLDRGVILGGRVVDGGGRPVAGAAVLRPRRQEGALVVVGRGSPTDPLTETDAEGRFAVESQRAGQWELIVRHAAHPDRLVDGELEPAGARATDLLVVLEDGLEIAGFVSDVPPDERGKLEVRAAPAPGGEQEAAPASFAVPIMGAGTSTTEVRSAAVDEDGAFVVRGLRQGVRYRLTARLADAPGSGHFGGFYGASNKLRSARAYALAGDRGVELAWSRGSAIVFRIVDAKSGKPVETLGVSHGSQWLEAIPERHFVGGEVRIDGLWSRGADERWKVRVTAPGYEPLEREGLVLAAEEELFLGVLALQPVPRITVTVRDAASGSPVPGARVVLREGASATEAAFPGGGNGNGETRTGETDDEGRCVLSSFPGRRARLTAEAVGYAPTRGDTLLLPADRELEVGLTLSPGGSVLVTVVDAAGAPVAGTRVEHRRPVGAAGESQGEKRSDAEGRARFEDLAPGEHAFRVPDDNRGADLGMISFGPGSEPPVDESWSAVPVAAGAESALNLVAPERARLTGMVKEDGRPLSDAKVALREKSSGFFALLGDGIATRTDGAGRFVFDDLRPDSYTLVVTHATRAMADERKVELAAGDNELSIDLTVCVIEGRAIDEEGRGVAGAEVTVTREGDGGHGAGMSFVIVAGGDDGDHAMGFSAGTQGPRFVADEDGRYALRGVLADVELFVKAGAEGYESATSDALRLAHGELVNGVDLMLTRPGTLVVQVVTADGELAEGITVRATFAGEDADEARTADTAGGAARFEGLRKGPWHVEVLDGSGAEPRTVTIVAGAEESVSFTLR